MLQCIKMRKSIPCLFGVLRPVVLRSDKTFTTMSTSVDPLQVASSAFREASNYDKARPGYTQEAVGLFLEKLNVSKDEPTTILELAAGTGKLTRELVKAIKDTNIQLIASEPGQNMGNVLHEKISDLNFISCRAEKIPLPDASVIAVVASAAAHYFANAEAFAEMHRVLAPGGSIGFLFQNPDFTAVPWAFDIIQESVICYQNSGVPYDNDKEGNPLVCFGPALAACGLFDDVQQAAVVEPFPMDETQALNYFMSYGAFNTSLSSEADRDAMRKRFKEILRLNYSGAGKTMTVLPMNTFLFWARKKLK